MIAALRRGAAPSIAATPILRGVLLDAEGPHFSFGASVEEHLPEQLRGDAGEHCTRWCCDGRIAGAGAGRGARPVPGRRARTRPRRAPDLRRAATPSFGQPEMKLGVFAPAASCLLPRAASATRRAKICCSPAAPSTGAEARRDGPRAAIAADPEAAALAYFDEHLADKSASSLRFAVDARARRLRSRACAPSIAEVERLYLDELMRPTTRTRASTAFIAKRPPQWEHR